MANKRGGGVGMYISKQLIFKICDDLVQNIEDVIETMFIEICRPSGKNLIIGVIYRPPNSKFELFENAINAILYKIERENKICYLAGDFNVDLLKSESCDFSNRFIEQLFTSSFFPLITKPTRITAHTATLIDNIYTNDSEKINNSINRIILTDISDHLPIIHMCNMDNYKQIKSIDKTRYTRTINDESIRNVTDEIRGLTWEEILNANTNPDNAYNNFLEIYLTAYEKHFPQKLIKNRIDKNRSPWMTNGLLKSVKRKNKLYKTFLKNPSGKNETKYKKYKNKLNHIIKISKKIYYEEKFIKYKSNAKMVWKTLNELLNKKRKNRELPREFFESNSSNTIQDPLEIANKFNEYFVNVGPKLAEKIRTDSDASYHNYLSNKNQNSMFLEPTTEVEIEEELKIMNINKSPGYDDINITKTIVSCAKQISKPLTHICNLSFLSGIIPDKLKIAVVTPVFKANEANKFENYRPISVLSCISKLLEKIMYKRLLSNFIKASIWV